VLVVCLQVGDELLQVLVKGLVRYAAADLGIHFSYPAADLLGRSRGLA
jgi:hypothetical protein